MSPARATRRRRAWSRPVAIGAVTIAAGLLFTALPFGPGIEEWAGLDLLFTLRGPRTPPPEVVIVAIDRPAAEALGLPSNPNRWPRTQHAELVDALHRGGAAAIVFDIVFDEPGAPLDDRTLADSLRRAGTVVLAQQLVRETVLPSADPRSAPNPFHLERLAPPVPPLAEAAAGLAPFPLPKVPVQVSRYWTFKAGAGNAPSLPVVAFHVYAKDAHGPLVALLHGVGARAPDGSPIEGAMARSPGHAEHAVRTLREAVERDATTRGRLETALAETPGPPGNTRERHLLERLARLYAGPDSPYLDFYGPPRTIPTIPYDLALARLSGAGSALDVRGKSVFVGLSAYTGAEQRDGVNTVFSQANGLDLSGVEIAATAFGNILEARSVEAASPGTQLAVAVGWGAALGLVTWRLRALASAAVLLLAGLAYFLVAQNRFAAAGLWLPLVGPLAVQMGTAFTAAIVWRHRDTRREREHLSTALAHYLPPKIAEELAREIGGVRAADQLLFGTCLSTDAHQYTALSETMEPAELGAFMNRYYEVLFEPVKRHGGVVQDVVGDSMLAVWATTEPDLSLRNRACLAALDIASAVDRFNAGTGRLALPTRVGLHSGRLLLGSVGAMDHYEYRAVGDIVNTATRLEGLNKHLGTRMLVSADVLQGLDGLVSRELGGFLLAGKSRPVLVHELIGRVADVTQRDRDRCAIFAEALAAYRRGAWSEAMRLWREVVRAHGGDDGPSQFYLRWCEAHSSNPPDANWDGVVRMDQK
ncbi:MAG TPA: adenylate/guanylate cyclase domain-containing protein [Methylomirabilota bacterium]|jgi:adenylate cyclase|nr:adenylate/guanylate cyclase domain-containing protein [Methylomirabilota bacterium]